MKVISENPKIEVLEVMDELQVMVSKGEIKGLSCVIELEDGTYDYRITLSEESDILGLIGAIEVLKTSLLGPLFEEEEEWD